MSASAGLTVLCGLLTCGGAAFAQESETPDLAFLEYLGSWEGSDEEWVLFSEEEKTGSDNDDESKASETEPVPQEEKVAELDDEN